MDYITITVPCPVLDTDFARLVALFGGNREEAIAFIASYVDANMGDIAQAKRELDDDSALDTADTDDTA